MGGGRDPAVLSCLHSRGGRPQRGTELQVLRGLRVDRLRHPWRVSRGHRRALIILPAAKLLLSARVSTSVKWQPSLRSSRFLLIFLLTDYLRKTPVLARVLSDHLGYCKPATRFQHPERLGKHSGLVCGQVDGRHLPPKRSRNSSWSPPAPKTAGNRRSIP